MKLDDGIPLVPGHACGERDFVLAVFFFQLGFLSVERPVRDYGRLGKFLADIDVYKRQVLRFDNDAMESLIDSDKGVLEAFSVVNALMARAVLIVPSLLDSSGSLLQVGLDDLLCVAGAGKGICSCLLYTSAG